MAKSKIVYCEVHTDGDQSSFYDMSIHDQALIIKWIENNLWSIKTINKYRTSYGIKHCFEHDTGVYIGNNAFKEAMLLCGFSPEDPNDLNWTYRVGECSPAFRHKYGTYDKQGTCQIEVNKWDIAATEEFLRRK